MSETELLSALAEFPRAMRIGSHDAWLASPDDVVGDLMAKGVEEYRREIVRGGRDRRPLGGVWQGLRPPGGAVVSVIWITRGDQRPAVVFVDVDDEPPAIPRDASASWWDEVDDAVVECVAGERSMTPAEIGHRLGMSESAATSIVAMLAQEGRLRIALVSAGDDGAGLLDVPA